MAYQMPDVFCSDSHYGREVCVGGRLTDGREREPDINLGICGTLVCDSGVIADQWGQEDWLTNDDYYVTNRSRLSQRCHRPRIAINQVLCTGFPVFKKEVQGQGGVESKVPVTKTRDQFLCCQ